MDRILEKAKRLYALEDCAFTPVSGHQGGRNRIDNLVHITTLLNKEYTSFFAWKRLREARSRPSEYAVSNPLVLPFQA